MDCKESETVDEVVAQNIQTTVLQNIVNMGVSEGAGEDDSDDSSNGLVTNFNSLTQEELA